MRQIWTSKAGPPEVPIVKEAPDPQPAAGRMRIRVEASGVNFADVLGRLGSRPSLHRADCSIFKQARAGRSKDAEGLKRFTRAHTSPNGSRDLVLCGRLG